MARCKPRRDFVSAIEAQSWRCKFPVAEYIVRMNAIAVELDQKLQSLDPETAASVEQRVRDALQWAGKKSAPTAASLDTDASHRAHIAKFAGLWAGDGFERPPQGEFEKREDW